MISIDNEYNFKNIYNDDLRKYFEEVIQSFYSKNYRGTIVLLYSLVIYDLYEKLKVMKSDNNKKAMEILDSIENKILNANKYSEIENDIINYFLENHPLYFNRFKEDVTYLKDVRNKCAHIQIDGDSLFTPKDYQVRMLINSMYENILIVKAPFIDDLFSFVKKEIDNLNDEVTSFRIFKSKKDDLFQYINKKYYSRMTDASCSKSLKTFLRLLLVSLDETAIEKFYGIYVFTFTLCKFLETTGKLNVVLDERSIKDKISDITIESLEKYDKRIEGLMNLMLEFPIISGNIKLYNNKVYEYIVKIIYDNSSNYIKYNPILDLNLENNSYMEFINNLKRIKITSYLEVYNHFKDIEKFDINDFIIKLCESVPDYYGFELADEFIKLFIQVFENINDETIKKVLNIYSGNNQFYFRNKHKMDKEKIMSLLDKRKNIKIDDIKKFTER